MVVTFSGEGCGVSGKVFCVSGQGGCDSGVEDEGTVVGGVEQDQFNELSALVHDVSLIPMSDRWKWDLESSGDFSVASVRKIIDDKSLSDVDSKTRWIKYVPIKVNVHAWKVKTDSLPTRFNVSRRGIDIDSIMCAICDNGVETSRHLFFYCCMVRQIVRKITRWWDVPYVEVESYEDWYNWLVNLRISSMHKQMFGGIDVMRRLVGTKVGGSMARFDAWEEVMNKVYSRLSKWKMKSLSIGGRLTLLKSVLAKRKGAEHAQFTDVIWFLMLTEGFKADRWVLVFRKFRSFTVAFYSQKNDDKSSWGNS
ncbi:RNA-directed DNA polymerase, eukaryota [Tanacetum coccineum]|uniref:RNA-directed DNA polymerase, eukaryota n=1 Tax=Tanacetum coccineum TaxID=301880 RepID=A0ABQ5H5Q1_9ASTR